MAATSDSIDSASPDRGGVSADPAGDEPAEREADPEPPSRTDPDQPDQPDQPLRRPVRVGAQLQLDTQHATLCDWLADRLTSIALVAVGVDVSLDIAIVDDQEMARLHGDYKGDPTTTDVLTFDLRDDDRRGVNAVGEIVEGEIVLCFDEARRQSAARGHAVDHELLLYSVHGLLHLLGYDDHTDKDAAVMHAREDELLCAAGIGPVYAGPTTPAADRTSV